MAAAIKKATVVFAAPALMGMGLFAGSAAADPATEAEVTAGGEVTKLTPANPAPSATCDPGFVCYYTGLNGTGAKCQWSGADRQHADDCSWAGDTNVRSIWNNGRDPAFAGVCSYRFPDFDNTRGPIVFQPQGAMNNLPGDGWKVLSHKWVRPGVGC